MVSLGEGFDLQHGQITPASEAGVALRQSVPCGSLGVWIDPAWWYHQRPPGRCAVAEL